MKNFLFKHFPAFQEPNFRLYFYGQVVSLTGTYLQSTAQGWLVLQMTHSAFWVGLVSALVFFPTFLLVLFGGVIVDRFDRRKLLYFTQISAMILAFVLGILTITGHVTLWEVVVLAFLLGVVNALDTPARSAFLPDMISDRNHLSSAISLNTALITMAQAVGPAIGGILIAIIGVGPTFIINGFTFVVVIIALFAMLITPKVKSKIEHPVAMIKNGFKYFPNVKGLVFLVTFSFFIAIFGRAYAAIFPIVATQFYNGDSTTLGWLLSAFGIGAALGGIFLSIYSSKISTRYLIIGGNILAALALLAFPLVHVLGWGVGCIILAGFGYGIALTTIITIIQHASSTEMRGRVMSIFFFIYYGGFSIGNFSIGWFTGYFGSAVVISASGVSLLIITAIFFTMRSRIIEIERG
jgi:MFS family permease